MPGTLVLMSRASVFVADVYKSPLITGFGGQEALPSWTQETLAIREPFLAGYHPQGTAQAAE